MLRIYNRLNTDRGASMIEYALLAVLIAIVALLAVKYMGQETSGLYSDINSGIVDARTP